MVVASVSPTRVIASILAPVSIAPFILFNSYAMTVRPYTYTHMLPHPQMNAA